MVARAEVLTRAAIIWTPHTVPYSQSAVHQPDGYRQDCSGYVSMCWALPPAGENTVTLVTEGHMTEIAVDELLPGDAVGLCGPGTAGDAGHVQLFERWLNDDPNDSRYYCWQQSGGRKGPTHDLVDWTDGYRAYRFRGIEEFDMDVLRAENPQQGEIDAWRLDALTYGLDEVRGGPLVGESMYVVQALKRVEAALADLGQVGDHTHVTGPALSGSQTTPSGSLIQ